MKAFSIVLAALFAASAAPAVAQEAPAEAAAPDYSQSSSWLCLPGRSDPCSTPLSTAALNPNGYGSVGEVRAATDASIDCFYVYPTVSADAGMNSDLKPGPEEQAAAFVQFARFASLCRPFAPVYRQATLASIPAIVGGADPLPVVGLAYGDVLAAWNHYLENHNQGRPFVLIGHSQGTLHLSQLLAREIEGEEVTKRMLSALLIGFNIEVPQGELVGGSFSQTPLCNRPGQTGCVITFVSFRATNPPPISASFGRSAKAGMTIGCTNPAALGRKGSAPLDSYWYSGPSVVNAQDPIAWSSEGAPPAPFLRTEGLVAAACVNRGSVGYLSVDVRADQEDARTDRIPGDVVVNGQRLSGWGLHLADMSLAMGDLLRAVELQRDAFESESPAR